MMLKANEWVMISRVTSGRAAGGYEATLFDDTGDLDVRDDVALVEGMRCRQLATLVSRDALDVGEILAALSAHVGGDR